MRLSRLQLKEDLLLYYYFITVAGFPIKLQSSIKSLGVYLDSHISLDRTFPRFARHHISTLCHIRSSQTTEAAKTIALSIVGSLLDYCNSLLACTSASNLARLQLVQNTLAELLLKSLGTATSCQFWPACTSYVRQRNNILKSL